MDGAGGMEMDRVALIDVASEDDLLVPCATSSFSFGDPSPTADPQTRGSWDLQSKDFAKPHGQTVATTSPQAEHVPVQPNVSKPKTSSSGALNLRKSLAWDSAFFTNEGMLDAEELAIVNSTFRKSETRDLPSIHEDLVKSTDSISSVGSGSWTTIESLELDLFDNLRASIQKDQAACGGSSTKDLLPKGNAARKILPASKRNTVSAKNSRIPSLAIKKDASFNPTSKEATQAPNGHDNKLSIKPPKAATTRVLNTQSRIPTPQLVQVKKSMTNLKSPGNCLPGDSSSIATPGGARRLSAINTPGSQTSSKMLSRVSSLNTKQGNSSSDPAPAITGSLSQTRKKVDRTSDKSSISIMKSPFVSSKNKSGTTDFNSQKSQLKYPSRFLSGVSPSSSIESLASESSSSSTSTSRKSDQLANNDMLLLYEQSKCDSSSIRKDDSVRISRNHVGNISSASSVSERSSALSNRPVIAKGNSGLKVSKPSGLRMPSPKLGYFDVVDKSLPCESTNSSQGGSKSVDETVRAMSVISQPSPRPNSCIPCATKPMASGLVPILRSSIEACVTPRLVYSSQEMKSSSKKDLVTRSAEHNELIEYDESSNVESCKVVEVGQIPMFGLQSLTGGLGTPLVAKSDAQKHIFESAIGGDGLSNARMPTVDCASGIQLDRKQCLVSECLVSECREKENIMPLEGTDYVLSKKREPNASVATIEQLEERLTVLRISSEINATEDVGFAHI